MPVPNFLIDQFIHVEGGITSTVTARTEAGEVTLYIWPKGRIIGIQLFCTERDIADIGNAICAYFLTKAHPGENGETAEQLAELQTS